jgi:outer membrane protein assembly factor BamB
MLDGGSGSMLGSYLADVLPAIGSKTGFFLQAGTMNAIDLGTDSVLWGYPGDGEIYFPPLAINNFIFMWSWTGNLYVLDSASGTLLKTYNLGPMGTLGAPVHPWFGLSAGEGLLVSPNQDNHSVSAFVLTSIP